MRAMEKTLVYFEVCVLEASFPDFMSFYEFLRRGGASSFISWFRGLGEVSGLSGRCFSEVEKRSGKHRKRKRGREGRMKQSSKAR